MEAKNIKRESIQNVLPNAPEEASTRSYGEILADVGESLKEIVQSDLSLMISELKQIQKNLGVEAKKIAIFGVVLSMGLFPIVAALIIGLGVAMGGLYWLSSLIVGVVLLAVGGFGLMNTTRKLKKIDIDIPKTKSAIRQEGQAIYHELNKVKVAVRGEKK